MKRFAVKNIFVLLGAALSLSAPSSLWSMGGTVPSGYPSSFMMGLVDDDYQDALNSYGQGTNAEVNTVSQYMVPTGASNWDAVYRYLQGGLACTGTGWYSQYPGSGGAIGNFANLANGSGFQPIFIYYQIGAVNVSSMSSATFMGEYFQDWEQFLIQINTWMSAHSGKVVTVDIEPDMFGWIQQNGYSPTSYTVSVASATKPSCTTPWVSLSAYANNLQGYCQAMLYLKDQEMSAGNNANLKIAFHVSGWAASPNPAATSGMSAGALATHASTVAGFLNACQPTSGSKFDLFFTDPSGYDGGYQSAYNWDSGGAMALQYANWLNDLTADVSLRCMLWQVPEGNSKMNNVLGHYTDTRPEYFLNDSPLNSAGYSHNICLYVNSGCVGVLWGPGDYHGTDVMDFFYPANYAASASQQDGSGNSGAGTWITPAVVDDDGGFFRTHIANNHTWGATCPLNASVNTATSTATFTKTQTATSTNTPANTATSTATRTSTNSSTPTAVNTNTFTRTQTATSTMSNTVGNTQTSTSTVTNTNTVGANTATFTNTMTSTSTAGGNTATSTSTQTATHTATATATCTSTSTSAPANSSTATVTSSATSTASSTRTPTVTETATGVLNTATSTGTSTVTLTQTSTNTLTITSTVTPSQTSTGTVTSTATSTMTDTPRPPSTATSTATSTLTATVTYTQTVTQTPTQTFTKTITPTPTATTVTRVICSGPYPNPVSSGPVKVDVMVPPGVSTLYMDVFTIALRKVTEQSFKTTGVTTTIQWNLTDRSGLPVADGLYYLRIRAANGASSASILKLLVLK